jgi:4-carboxymuconolactone decarboxylase
MAGRNRSGRVRRLAAVAGAAALGRESELGVALRAAIRAGVTLRALRETLLQVHLFAGFPRAVNALEALERAAGGVLPAERPERAGAAAHRRRGVALFRRVYGADATRVLAAIGARHAEFRDWILVDAYGKVLGRRGLSAAERECLAVALLASLDLPRQQIPHVRGALRCGATVAEVRAALAGVRHLAPPGAVRFAGERLRKEAGLGPGAPGSRPARR